VTTNPGHLPAKQTSVNPNFAAVVVHMLKRVHVSEGDVVAVGLSGSFPALNLSVLAAIQSVGAKGIVITSVGSSQWGANIPSLLWPDIEQTVFDHKIIRSRSSAYSLGGIDDRALGLSDNGKAALKAAVERSGIPLLEAESYEVSVEKRVNLYSEMADDEDIIAYINVGGGTSSVGTRVGKKLFKPGLNRSPPQGVLGFDSVMSRFIMEEIPVIHLSSIDILAVRYGLPLQPKQIPEPGMGKVFRREVYNNWLAGATLALLVLFLWVFARLDLGYRLLAKGSRQKSSARPQQMV
jgi:poly-gamma-glutamate system protein